MVPFIPERVLAREHSGGFDMANSLPIPKPRLLGPPPVPLPCKGMGGVTLFAVAPSYRSCKLSLMRWRPTQSSTERLPVELALHRVDRTSIVESEHFIIQIQAIRYCSEPFR
jgi:hypothetical protein